MTKHEKAVYDKIYYNKHKIKILKRQKQYELKHKRQRRKYRQQYYQEHKKEQQVWQQKYYQENKERLDAASKKWIKEHRKRRKYAHIKSRYGITKQELKILQQLYKGHCAICDKKTKLFIDHNHKSKKVRGLLCFSCNILLGCAKDNKIILDAAKRYLRKVK